MIKRVFNEFHMICDVFIFVNDTLFNVHVIDYTVKWSMMAHVDEIMINLIGRMVGNFDFFVIIVILFFFFFCFTLNKFINHNLCLFIYAQFQWFMMRSALMYGEECGGECILIWRHILRVMNVSDWHTNEHSRAPWMIHFIFLFYIVFFFF